jgi:hypothetical protein
MPKSVALIVAVAPVLGGLLLVATMHWDFVFAWLIAENSLVESSQFGVLAAATCLLFWIGIHLLRRRSALGLAYALVALGAFFVAGEEISWGQTIFDWDLTNRLTRSNFQGETNLHTGVAHGPTVYGFVLIAAYGTCVPLVLAPRLLERRRPVMFLLVPPLALVPAFFIPFAYRLLRTAFNPEEHLERYAFDIVRFAEYAELSLYAAVLVTAVLTWRLYLRRSARLTSTRSEPTP